MTSAKSFFNWIKEAERGHLTAFLSWSAFCIYCIIKITVLSVDTEYTFFGIGSTELLYICAGLGAALGFTEFFYLLQPKKLALYYSLPVTKACIFWTRYLHGLFHFLLPLSLSMAVLSIYQSSVDLTFYPYILSYTSKSILVYAGVFLLLYHIVICSVVLCGGLIPAALLSTGFLCYFQLLINHVFLPLSQNCFQTYYKSPLLESLYACLVPFEFCRTLCGTFLFDKTLVLTYTPTGSLLLTAAIWILLLFCLFALGQKKRKPEMAGKIFAFTLAERTTEILLTFLAGLLCTSFLFHITNVTQTNLGLAVLLSFICIAIVSFLLHLLLEALVQDSHRILLRRKMQPLLTGAAAVCTSCAFLAGASAYDSYFPQSEQVDSLSISIAGLDMDEDMYSEIMYGNSYATDKQLDLYRFSGEAKTLGMSWLQSLIEAKETSSRQPAYEEDSYTTATVCYHLKNKKEHYRVYTLSKEMFSSFASVYETDEYKTIAYPVSAPDSLGDTGKDLFIWSDGITDIPLSLSSSDKKNLLDAYSADVGQMKMESLSEDLPTGILTIESQKSGTATEILVYPFFTQTNALLQSIGIDTAKSIADYPIISIEIFTHYSVPNGYNGGVIRNVYETPEEIEVWKNRLVPEEFDVQPLLYPLSENPKVKIENKETNSYTEIKCRLKEEYKFN